MAANQPQPDGVAPGGPAGTEAALAADLERLGLKSGPDVLAVIAVADSLYRPLIEALMAAELPEVAPEPGPELGSAPRELRPR